MTDQLRHRIAAALEREDVNWGYHCGFSADPATCDMTAAYADAVLAKVQDELDRLQAENTELATELGARDDKARKRWIKNQEKQLGIRFADFRNGRWEMDLAMGREMAAAYVAMAKTMLGDGPNYSETKLEFEVKIAESPELYTLVVQRHAPGALTPHEARQRAETEVAVLRRLLAEHITNATILGDKATAGAAAEALAEQLAIHDVDLSAEYAALTQES